MLGITTLLLSGFGLGALGRFRMLAALAALLVCAIVIGFAMSPRGEQVLSYWPLGTNVHIALISINLLVLGLPAFVIGAMLGVLAALVFGFGIGKRRPKVRVE